MIGDSTMAIKTANKYPETGWGVPFSSSFSDGIIVENNAMNGRSTRSFMAEQRWTKVYEHIRPGDYVFVQFGHNDQKVERTNVGTAVAEYAANLSFFVKQTREKGAVPVLLTPISRRRFVDGMPVDTHAAYAMAMRDVADSLAVLLIDLTHLTTTLLQQLGEDDSKRLFLHLDPGHPNYPDGIEDDTHLNAYGAKLISDMVLQELIRQQIPICQYMKDKQ